jgi:choline dehydrogenase-like flavoprotein
VDEEFDVVIVGSGYGGAIPAMRLAESGLRVLVLERGARMSTADLRQSDDPKYLQQVVDLVVSSSNVAFRTGTMVGGASIPMDGAHFRMPQQSFEVQDSAGRRYWPEGMSRAEFDPYYERVEEMLHVRQFGWSEIPKAGGLFAKMMDEVGASSDRARMNYTDCNHCGFCAQGCTFDKKMTLLHTYIPRAEAAGAEFRADSMVDHIEPRAGRAGYAVHYQRDGVMLVANGARVIVGCGGIHTPALLLRSREHLTGLGDHVGRHFNNNGEHGYLGILPPEFDDLDSYHCYKGMDNSGMMSFHWFASQGFSLHPGGGFEPSVLAAAIEASDHPVLPKRAWGMEYKRFVEEIYPHRLIGFSSLGLADGHRDVVIRDDGSADFEETDRAGYDAYLDRLDTVIEETSDRTGVTLLPAVPRQLSGMTSAHLLSSCRMADSAADGVVNRHGEVFGHEGLFVCDASSVPYALGVNPALTVSVLAERTAEHILGRG